MTKLNILNVKMILALVEAVDFHYGLGVEERLLRKKLKKILKELERREK